MNEVKLENQNLFELMPPEIVRYILTFLDESTLLLLSRTSKMFQQLIQQDPILEQYAPNLKGLLALSGIKFKTARIKESEIQMVGDWLEIEKQELQNLETRLQTVNAELKELVLKEGNPPAEIVNFKHALENLSILFKIKQFVRQNPSFFKVGVLATLFFIITLVVFSPLLVEWNDERHKAFNDLKESPAWNPKDDIDAYQHCFEGEEAALRNLTQAMLQICEKLLENFEYQDTRFVVTSVLFPFGDVIVGFGLWMLLDHFRDKRDYLSLPIHQLAPEHQALWQTITNKYPHELRNAQIHTIGDILNFLDTFLENRFYVLHAEIQQGQALIRKVQNYLDEIDQSIQKQTYSAYWSDGQPKQLVFQNANQFFRAAHDFRPRPDIRVVEEQEEDMSSPEKETDLLLGSLS